LANTLAYYNLAAITAVRSFIVQSPALRSSVFGYFIPPGDSGGGWTRTLDLGMLRQ
jgi:hypothetical protein